jgi:signal transduction histidine kinase
VTAERLALLGRFAQSIVHDLKNPLTIIRMATSVACGEDSTAAKREQSQRWINQQLDRMIGLVNDILDYARPAASVPA